MCRLFSMFSTNNTKIGPVGKDILLHMVANSLDSRNKDGFFIADNRGAIIRTLSQLEYLDFIVKAKFEDANWVSAHLRASTNEIDQKWVHGWKMAGYMCCHNGVVQLKEFPNDSFSFFSKIQKSDKGIFDAIKKVSDDTTGWGVFSMVNNYQKIFFSFARDMYVYYVKEHNLLVITSNSDVWEFKKTSIDIEDKEFTFESFGCLYFAEEHKHTSKVQLNPVTVHAYEAKFEDKFLVLDKNNKPEKLEQLVKAKVITGYYNNNQSQWPGNVRGD